MWEFVYDTLTHGSNLDPTWAQKMFLGLIFQEFCDFSGTWDSRYWLFLRMQFMQKFWVLVIFFGFLAVNWALKWTKTVNFSCIPFELKFKFLKDFSNIVFFLLENTYGQSFSKIKQYLGE